MASLSDELINSAEDIVEKWCEAWKRLPYPQRDLSEASLKSRLATQLRLIGKQIRNLETAEEPGQMWKLAERLEPELRIAQQIPIEELVQEYSIVVEVVRAWIEERGIEVPFQEYSYFYRALAELTAESVRRYSAEQANIISGQRARYLASLAHQMRGPLSSFSVLLQQVKQSNSQARQVNATIVSICDRNLKRLIALIDRVLKLERFRLEEIIVRPESVCPADVIRDVIADNSHDATAKGLHIENAVDPSLRMDIDPALFLDAIGNLVQNAVKYTDSGLVRVEADAQSDGVVFKIIDSGPGVSADQQRELFHTVQPGQAAGVGIGLLIVHRAVTAQGGTLGVESAPGKGSVFWFRLPRVVKAQNLDEASS